MDSVGDPGVENNEHLLGASFYSRHQKCSVKIVHSKTYIFLEETESKN